jgi:hypothetical protein
MFLGVTVMKIRMALLLMAACAVAIPTGNTCIAAWKTCRKPPGCAC